MPEDIFKVLTPERERGLILPAGFVPASEVFHRAAEDFLLEIEAFLQEKEDFLAEEAYPVA